MNRVIGVLVFAAIYCASQIQAQTPPNLTAVTSDEPAKGIAKLPGFAINVGQGPMLTFHGSNFSKNMIARFSTIDLQGEKGTLDIPFGESFVNGEQDSGRVKLEVIDEFGSFNSEQLIISTGPIYLVDQITGLRSADSVDIVIVPSVYSILKYPHDLPWHRGPKIVLTAGEVLYVEGSGLVQDSTILIFPIAGGDTLHVRPVAVGSAVRTPDGEGFDFRADTLDQGLMAQFVVPADIAVSGSILIETNSGISRPYFFKKPNIESIIRLGLPLRGTPADPTKLSVNARDTLQFSVSNLAVNNFPSIGPFLSLPGVSRFFVFDFISPDSSLALATVPPEMLSGNPLIANEYSHRLELFTYSFISEPGPFVQIIPTLDSLKGISVIAPGFYINLYGGGLKQSSGSAVVKFTKAGGGTTDVFARSINGSQLTVRIPDDAISGPVYVETEGGRSNSLQLTFKIRPLEIIATAVKGTAADTSQASANSGQTIIVKSEGILPTMRLKLLSGSQPTFQVNNISSDSTTAEVTLSTLTRVETGLVRLEDQPTQTISESKLLQIVPTLDWVSSPGFAPGNAAYLWGNDYIRDSTTVTFTDSAGADREAEITSFYFSLKDRITVILPSKVTQGLVRVSTNGGSDTLYVIPPVLTKLIVTAHSGTPADSSLPSTNIGQVMRVEGENLTSNTDVRFLTVDQSGNDGFVDFDLLNISTGTEGEVTVGSSSFSSQVQIATGVVKLLTTIPDFKSYPLISGRSLLLQIVPTITSFDVATFAPGEVATIRGSGLIQGQTHVFFSDSSANPIEGLNVDVVGYYNNELQVTLPQGAIPGPINVQTDGGTSLSINILPPQIFSVSPDEGVRGSALQMTLDGANFSIGSQVSFSGSGITVDTTAFFSPSMIITAVRIDVNAPPGARDVIITNPAGDADTLLAGFSVIPDQELPSISQVTQLPNTGDIVGPYPVQASISDNIGIQNAFLVYSTNNFITRDSVAMSQESNLQYRGNIPGQVHNTTVNYFISAFDFEGNRATEPPDAPKSSFSFQVLLIPVFQPISDQSVDEGQLLSFTVRATDPDNDPIAFSAINLPPGATFSDSIFSWIPDYKQSGTYIVTFTADDKDDGVSSIQVKIVINEITDPPVVRGPSSRVAYVGQLLEIPFSISDPDGDNLTVDYIDHPSNSTIYDQMTAIKFFRWRPTIADVGIHKPKFIAKDSFVSDTLIISILVTQPSSPIVQTVKPTFGHVGDVVTMKGIAFGEGSATLLFNGVPSAAVTSGDTMAMAFVPLGATSGPLALLSSNLKLSNEKFFAVLPPPTVNLVAKSLESSAPMVMVGNPVTLTAQIENRGAFAASANLTFFDDHPDSGGVALGSPTFFNIAPGDQIKRTFEWLPQTAGFFIPYMRVSGADPRENRLEDNIVANDAILVLESSGLELVNIYAPPEEFIIDKPKNYTITLLNSGTQTALVNAITVDGYFGFVPLTILPLSLPPGTIHNFVFTVTLPANTPSGDHSALLRILTDRGNEFSQSLVFKAVEDNQPVTIRLLDDDSGLPLAGARVFANETEQPSTNSNGEVTIEIASNATTLVVFFKKGYLPTQVELSTTKEGDKIDVFIKPGEILVSNVDVQPLSVEDIEQFGLDLNDPENFNYYLFSVSIQFGPDEPPVEVEWVGDGSPGQDTTQACGEGEIIAVKDTLLVNENATNCYHKFKYATYIIYDSGDTCATFRHPLCGFKRERKGDCDPPEIVGQREETREFRDWTCTYTVWEICGLRSDLIGTCCFACSPLTSDGSRRGPMVGGGAVNPSPDVTIPYAVAINGAVRNLKEFFSVTLAVGNQADPYFSVSDLNVELISTVGEIVKEADPLPNISGGESATTTWIVRGDVVGTHAVEVRLNGRLQPGDIPISAAQFSTVIVNEPPRLDLVLQHPEEVEEQQTFMLSATVTNLSESTVARETDVEILLENHSTAELLSDPRQELGDLSPGESRMASWQIKALGSGKVKGCNQSIGNKLGFTVLIGDQSCEDPLPSDTEQEEEVPAGKVVILGTDVPAPNILIEVHAPGAEGHVKFVSTFADDAGEYKLPKKVSGQNLPFFYYLQGVDVDQLHVRPAGVKFLFDIPESAIAMPTIEVGASNRYTGLWALVNSLQQTEGFDELINVINRWYTEPEQAVRRFLEIAELEQSFTKDLEQTAEEYFRLYLAQTLLARSRYDARDTSLQMTRALGYALTALLDIYIKYTRIDELLKDKIINQLGGKENAKRILDRIYQEQLDEFYKYSDKLFEKSEKLALAMLMFAVKSNPDFIGTKILEQQAKAFIDGLRSLALSSRGGAGSFNDREQSVTNLTASTLLRLYGYQTNELITDMRDLAFDYKGPPDFASLPKSFEKVELFQIQITRDTENMAVQTEALILMAQGFRKVSNALTNVLGALAIASATPAAPITVPLAAAVSTVKEATGILKWGTSIGSIAPAAINLYWTIPGKLQNGVKAAFDVTLLPSESSLLSTTLTSEPIVAMAATSRLTQDLSAAITNLQNAIAEVKDWVTRDSVAAAGEANLDHLQPASDRLNTALAQTEALLEGAAFNSFVGNAPDVDSLFTGFADSLFNFDVVRWFLPITFMNYAILGEVDGDINHPDYPAAKQEVLEALNDLDSRAGLLNNQLLSTLAIYEARGLLRATAAVDSIWLLVDGMAASVADRLPASITVNARVRNMFTIPLSNLNLELEFGGANGLIFDPGFDSIQVIATLAPDDGMPGGADEHIANWNLTYQGAFDEEEIVVFTPVLSSDSVFVHTAASPSVILRLRAADADSDGIADDFEVRFSLDPTRNDATEDPDVDFASNLQEFIANTDPHMLDTDGDGISDGAEMAQSTDPLDASDPIVSGSAALTLPLALEVASGDTVCLSVSISTQSLITFARFTIDYDATLLYFEEVKLDANLLYFTLDSVNTNPGFAPSTPGANKNVLVQLSSPNSSFTGSTRPVAMFHFIAITTADTTTKISFDRNADHTTLRDQDNFNLNVVSFTDATIAVKGTGPEPPVPTEFILEQNYPNPFNRVTTIKYQLPREADVELVVYNILGQKVQTLVNKRQATGFYNVQWEAKNQRGFKVASGLYIYRIKAGKFVQAKKMLLLR